MKIVQGDEVPWKRGLEHRGGTFHYSGLLDGEPGLGHVGDQPLRGHTAVFFDHNQTVTFTAQRVCELLYLGLPDLWHLLAASGDGLTASAAE